MADNYDFQGIGKAAALLEFSALAASPVSWLTNGVLGQITFWLLTQMNAYLASKGLILLNIGIANVQVLSQKSDFDQSLDEAYQALRSGSLTEVQKKALDDKVIAAFNNFADFGVQQSNGDSRSSPVDNSSGIG